MQFKTKVDVVIYKDKVESIYGKAILSWSTEIEARSWGIKGITIVIPDQEIEVDASIEDEDGNEEIQTLKMNIKDVNVEVRPDQYGMIAPRNLEFFKEKWEVT